MHGISQPHLAKITRPVSHQMQTEASVIEKGQMRASVAERDQAVGMIQ